MIIIFLDLVSHTEDYPGLVLQSAEFESLTNQTKPLRIEFKFTIPNFVSPAGEELKCKNGLKPLALTQKFISQSERKFPLQIREPFYRKEKSQIILSEGHKFVWTPQGVNQKTPFGNYELNIKQEEMNSMASKSMLLAILLLCLIYVSGGE
ncbi:MAG: hypothetical protein ABSC14_10485 [Desulfomonilia bacterium]